MNKVFLAIIFTLWFLALGTIAYSAEFIGYEGKDSVREGQGGAKKAINGIDFWSDGEPPYKYKLIGYITDRRHRTGLFGKISMSSLETDIAAEAKKVSADAVILVFSDAETVGVVGNVNANSRSYGNTASTTGFGSSRAVQKNNSKYAVIQYLKIDSNVVPNDQQNNLVEEPIPSIAEPY